MDINDDFSMNFHLAYILFIKLNEMIFLKSHTDHHKAPLEGHREADNGLGR